MSGTSADGIDVAVVRIAPGNRGRLTKLRLLAHEGFAFPPALRRAVLAAMNALSTSTAELARLNWRLGLAYAEAVAGHAQAAATGKARSDRLPRSDALSSAARSRLCRPQIRLHLAGRRSRRSSPPRSAFPWSRTSVPADMLAGGQGAPLVPLLDYVLFASSKRGRVLQNIGGIANLTAIPAVATPGDVIAFDTGPGNMVIDALAHQLFGKALRPQRLARRQGHSNCARAQCCVAQSLLQAQASAHRRTRAIWPRVCRKVSFHLAKQQAASRKTHWPRQPHSPPSPLRRATSDSRCPK